MRSFLVGLQLLLSCTLILGSPGSSSEEDSALEESEEMNDHDLGLPDPSLGHFVDEMYHREETSEELEEQAERHRHAMEMEGNMGFRSSMFKRKAIEYFNEISHGPFYRQIEDLDIKVKAAVGTMIHFSMFLVETNCTKQEGRQSLGYDPYSYMDQNSPPLESLPCVTAPKHQRKPLKCSFKLFVGRYGLPSVVDHYCIPAVIFEDREETSDD